MAKIRQFLALFPKLTLEKYSYLIIYPELAKNTKLLYNDAVKKEEHKIIFENEKILVEEIKSFGWRSPSDEWFDQPEKEVVFLVKGDAVLEFEKEKVLLKKGDSYIIEAHQKHRVDFTSQDCEWLCIFFKKP